MRIFEWYNQKLSNLGYWDIISIKTASFLLGIIIGAQIPGFVENYLWVIVAIIVILTLKLMIKLFKK